MNICVMQLQEEEKLDLDADIKGESNGKKDEE